MKLSREAIQRMVGDRVGGSGAGGAGISGNQVEQMLAGYATQEWTANNYISIDFFGRLFQAYNGTTAVNPNDITTTIDNIKAMFGFWTEQYISALGQGPGGGGGGGTGDVTWALLADNSDDRQIASSHITDLLGGTFIGKNYAVQRDANGKLYVNVPWENTTYTLAGLMGSAAKGGTTQPIYWNGSVFVNTSYTLGKSVPSDAKFTDTNTWRSIYTGGTSRVGTGTDTKALNFLAGSNIDIIYTAAGTGEGESGSADYFNIEIKAKNVYDSSVSRTKNTVLAAPNGSNGAATFRALVAADIPSLAASKITSGTFDAARIPTLAISKISGLQDALNSKLDIAFFSSMFKAYAGTTEIAPNGGDTTTIDNIKAMFGFWTEQYISALGQGSGGGGGGQGDVTWTLLADNSDTRQIASSHITDLLGGTFSGKNYAVQRDTNGKLYVNVSWVNTTYSADNGVGLSGTTFYNSGVRSTTINGNYLRVNTNGTNADLTIPYATNAGTALVGNKLNVMATISGQNTANYPWRLIAQSAEITTSYADIEAVIVLRKFTVGGKTGSIKIAFKTNEIATTASGVSAVWLDRYGFDVDDVKIAVYWVANKSYADVFLKATAWNRMEMHVIGNRNWSFVSSSEGVGGSSPVNAYASIEAAATAIHGRAYTNIVSAQDGGIVSYANSAGAATNDSDGNAINNTYLKKSGGIISNPLWGQQLTLKRQGGTPSLYFDNGSKQWWFYPSNDDNNVQKWYVGTNLSGADVQYEILTGINSSVSKSGETLTVKINGTSQSLTNTWRPVVDNLTSTDTDKSLSANQGKALKGYIDTLNSRFDNNGNAYTALALTTVSKTAWGQTFWTANGVPDSISGNMSSVGDISFSASGKKIGGFLYFDTTNSRLGIGTSSPSYKLHVAGTGYFTDTLTIANNKGVYMLNTGSSGCNVLDLSNSNDLHLGYGSSASGYDTIVNGKNVYLRYGTSRSNGMILNSSGNVGIGTTSPSYKLHVSGDVYATGGVTSLSDIRKKNVIDYELPLTIEQIADAPTIRFTWKDGREEDEQVGTVAQYWQKVLPQVTRDKNDELSMQYGVAALVATITTARKVIDNEKRICELEKECERLKTENEQLRLKNSIRYGK